MTAIMVLQVEAMLGQPGAIVASAFFAAVPGASLRGSCAPPTATGTPPSTGTTTSDSALPGRFSEAKAYFLSLYLLGVQGAKPPGRVATGSGILPAFSGEPEGTAIH